jgi:hypothetical protein
MRLMITSLPHGMSQRGLRLWLSWESGLRIKFGLPLEDILELIVLTGYKIGRVDFI